MNRKQDRNIKTAKHERNRLIYLNFFLNLPTNLKES